MHIRVYPFATLLACGCLFWGAAQARPAEDIDPKLKQDIITAIDRGVAFLRRTQARDGTWQHQAGGAVDNTVGATALCAVALIEAQVPIDDNGIQKAATFVRSKVKELNYTYAIAAAIIFLDKINKGGDTGNIKLLADKLIQGQQGDRLIQGKQEGGGWTYYCPNKGGIADNSNGQFALLALWIAHRSGSVNAKGSFQRAEQYFRDHQQNDGGWAYQFVFGPLGSTNPQMTCAGLMALAFGHSSKYKKETQLVGTERGKDAAAPPPQAKAIPDLKADKAVLRAKDYLAQFMARPFHMDEHGIYSLWTLERMCMIYGYTQFNGIDWYTWGAKIILGAQRSDGGWATDAISGRNCETAWAVLFLRKADLAFGVLDEAIFTPGNMKGAGRPAGGNAAAPPPPRKVEPNRPGKPGEAKALAEDLRIAVDEEKIEEILNLFINTDGPEYTPALAGAIGNVRAAMKERVRGALQKRLNRFKRESVQQYLATDDKELKLAALAVLPGKEKARESIPEIIPLLRDRDVQVSIAAHETLKKISGKDHPRDANAWQRWWDDGGK